MPVVRWSGDRFRPDHELHERLNAYSPENPAKSQNETVSHRRQAASLSPWLAVLDAQPELRQEDQAIGFGHVRHSERDDSPPIAV